MAKVLKQPIETAPKINYSIIKQIIKDKKHPLDMVREAISNMGDEDVGAKNCEIEYYMDPTYGSSFIFRDDGCGMRYSGDENNPERLDKFIHFGFSKTSGFESGKLGEKGLGANLILDSKKVEIRTWTGRNTDKVYYVEINDPRSKIFKTPTEPPKVYITPRDPDPSDKRGTEIKVYGYSDPEREYLKKEIREYLYYRTLVGYTKGDKDKLPKFILNYMGKKEDLEPGFPYITKLYDDKGKPKWDTIITDPPIEVSQNSKGTEVKITLKGGLTVEPGKFNVNDRTGGLFLSVYGIPYFDLDFNKYKGEFKQYKRFCRFVVECDILGDKEKLNINRGNFDEEDEIVKAFKFATKKAFNLLASRPEYKDFLIRYSKRKEREKSIILNERKTKLNDPFQKYVYYKEKFLHRLPKNEHDTLALFWKLEGMGALPFSEFHSLEHTNQSGVDVIANYQEEEVGEKKFFVAVEFESSFEEYLEHGHNPAQTSLIICWEIKNPDKLEKLKDYKYRATIQDVSIDVIEIKSFPDIEVKKGLQK